MIDGRVEHVLKFVFIFWGHDHHVRDYSKKGKIEDAMMSRAVIADNTASVNGERYRQVGQADIMYDLIKGTLQKRRIDGNNGPQAFNGHAGSKGYGMLLGYADIKKSVGKAFREVAQTGSGRHGRRDRYHTFVLLGDIFDGITKNLCVRRDVTGSRTRDAGLDIERPESMVITRMLLRGQVSFAFCRYHMNKRWFAAAEFFNVSQSFQQRFQVMAGNRPDILKIKGLEKHTGSEKAFETYFTLFQNLENVFTHV
jgi:hypothetical protein